MPPRVPRKVNFICVWPISSGMPPFIPHGRSPVLTEIMAELPMQFQHILFPEVSKGNDASGFAMKDWNVVITVNDNDSFRKVRREFQRFGDIGATDYHNVLVLRVPDASKFVEHFSSIIETDKSLLNCVSRVTPARFAFDFLTAEDFRIKARSIALGWLTVLCGHSFHVRMHRRGLKSELPSPSIEQFLDDAILTAASERGAPSRIDFSDPDYVIDVETVGNRAGLTLWSRNELRRLPFLRVD